MDDEDVNVSSDVVLVALADVGGSVDVDSTAIKYNHNVTVYCNAVLKTNYALMRFANCTTVGLGLLLRPIAIIVPVHPLHISKTKS